MNKLIIVIGLFLAFTLNAAVPLQLNNSLKVQSVSANYTVLASDDLVLVNAASGTKNLTLPNPSTVKGKSITIKKSDTSANAVVIAGLINGGSSYSISNSNGTVELISIGSSWSTKTIHRQLPIITKYTSGSGTHTVTGSPSFIRVRMVGGGGGGSSNYSGSGQAGGAGGATTFGSSLLTANGGNGGLISTTNGGQGGTGGTVTVSAPAISVIALQGGTGTGGADTSAAATGGAGASSPFGGAGGGGAQYGSANAGRDAVVNSGSGGGGASVYVAGYATGSGGGSGGYIEALIPSPSATYSYSVGAAGAFGDGVADGGLGGSGIIIIEEHYQ